MLQQALSEDLALAEIKRLFSDRMWRLSNLYFITDETGAKIKFQPNWAQEQFLRDLHYFNIVLKARQLGFTTLWQILMLDVCLFNANIQCGTIAHTLNDAKKIFEHKIKFPYENLPNQLRAAVYSQRDNTEQLTLSNNSSIYVGTSLRGGTLQYLHVSEYGKICAKYPDKAREIRTGALNTVHAGQFILVESTAEGQDGDFYAMTERAQALHRMGTPLTPLDFKFHFYPWHRDPKYRIDPAGVVIDEEAQKHFDWLENEHGVVLDAGQKAWWAKKRETQQDDMGREYPATPEEAFAAAVDGSYYGKAIARLEKEGRIGKYPAVPGVPVHTAHDIGVADYHGIWFFQELFNEIRNVGFYQNCGEGMPFYARYCDELYARKGWTRDGAEDWFPHDLRVKEWGTGRSRIEQAKDHGFRPRIPTEMSLSDGINAVRAILPQCTFDQEGCAEGIRMLKNYKKQWNERTAAWMSQPLHNEASHGADAFRTEACAHKDIAELPGPKPEKRGGISLGSIRDEMIRQGTMR